MDDLVRKKAVIDAVHKYFVEQMEATETIETEDGGVYDLKLVEPLLEHNKALSKRIEGLPSVQMEPHWTPCSEMLPEEKKDVLIAFKHNMVVGFWEDILDNGEPVWYANSGDGWMTGTATVDSDGIPIAWMPLPEPYKGES